MALLDHLENIRHFDLYHVLHCAISPLKSIIVQEDEEVMGIDPTLLFITRINPQEE